MKRLNNYSIKTCSIKQKEGCFNTLFVEIYKDNVKVGEYNRNYHTLYATFLPFEMNGKEYALYSHDYETVSVMSLPDCKLVAEDVESTFCPVDFAIPQEDEETEYFLNSGDLKLADTIMTTALVAGCFWGDDLGGWKIQSINLSKLDKGEVKVEDIFGYFESHYTGSLQDNVSYCFEKGFQRIELPLKVSFQFEANKEESGFLGFSMSAVNQYSGKRWKNFRIKEA